MTDTILITGASRGIGLATAKLLSEQGFDIIGIARNRSDDPFPGTFYAADLGDETKTDAVMRNIMAKHPKIDGVVNNVGINVLEALGEVDLDNFRRVIDINMRIPIQITQALLPGMKERGYGRIVNLSSRGALGREFRTSYGAAKAGIVGMTRTWALELAKHGITVNCVSPGPTETEMFRKNNLEGPKGEENRRKFLSGVPMDRFGQPDEIAFAIAVFIDRRASFMTGQLLHACGGSSVGVTAL